MLKRSRWALACLLLTLGVAAVAEENTREQIRAEMRALNWQAGPATAAVGSRASLKLPAGASFLDEKEGAKFLKLTGNLPSDNNILVGDNWWAALSFSPVGYVKDDEKIDADDLLKTLREQDGPANEERRKLGMGELHTDGWHIPPHYDPATKHLEWALRLSSPGSTTPTINYTVRLLGRSGYESATLVSDPSTLDADVKAFKAVLQDFDFNGGEKYAEFKQGDRVAEFGLMALVAGGAAAVATKTGFWKAIVAFAAAFWKLIAGGVVAAVYGIGKLFGRKKAEPKADQSQS
jgi:uncharacterized membrane-anchored protein